MNDKTVAVLGGGSWGTVLANLSAERGFKTTLWMRDNEVVEQVNLEKQNSKYLPGYILSDNLLATNEIEAISSSDLVVFCIPSDSFRDIAQKAAPHIKSTSHLVTATKGVEENGFILMSHILSEIFGDERPIGVLSGPNLASEISKGQITGTVIASSSEDLQSSFVKIFSSDSFRVYVNEDIYGVEMGGALKNIFAIACGIADGLDSGENTIGMTNN